MAGLQDAVLNEFANELEREAQGREVWAFIATYDETGQFAWKAYAIDEDEDGCVNDVMLGSKKIKFSSVTDAYDPGYIAEAE